MTGRIYRFLYSNQAEKFLRKHPAQISVEQVEDSVIKAIQRITREEVSSADVIALKGQHKGYFRVRIGGIRVLFNFLDKAVRIVDIHVIDFRGGVYQ